jgi:hypothetical protein
MGSFIIREAAFSDINRITELRLMAQQHFEKSNPSIWRMTKEGERLLKQKVENDLTDDNVQVARAKDGNSEDSTLENIQVLCSNSVRTFNIGVWFSDG